MNKTMNTILIRRSTRKFPNKSIPNENLQQMIQAVLHVLSGMGKQTWQSMVVENREEIRELASVIKIVLNREGYDMYQPEALVVPSNDRESLFGREGNVCAMENIFLAAHSMGIGSVWINQLQGICDDPVVHQVLSSLGIPQGHVVYGMAALGYVDDEKAEKEWTGRVVIVEQKVLENTKYKVRKDLAKPGMIRT